MDVTDPQLKVALIHDWLTTLAGAEKVLQQLCSMFPQAPVYTIVCLLDDQQKQQLGAADIKTSFIQRLPRLKKGGHRRYLPLMPLAIEQFDLTGYDLIISSSHAVAKGIIAPPGAVHACYCHSPMRYAWDLQSQYLASYSKNPIKQLLARWQLHRLRNWDVNSSHRVDGFIANSSFVASRIQSYYRRSSTVIHPPADLTALQKIKKTEKQDYFLAAGRLVSYKNTDLIIKAFMQMPDKQLVIIGDGPERETIKKLISCNKRQGYDNIHYLGYLPDTELHQSLSETRALIVAAEEDFGILPLEAQACGTPVIAYTKGGTRETLREKVTGLLYPEQTVSSLIRAVQDFEAVEWSKEQCKQHAEKFSEACFQEKFKKQLQRIILHKLTDLQPLSD